MTKTAIMTICLACFLGLAGCATSGEPSKTMDLVGLSGKQPEEAELAFAKAYILWHGYRPSHLIYSDACTNPPRAVELLSEAIALAPAFHEAYAYRALARKDLKEYDKALSDINKAITLESSPNYLAFRALILTLQKKFNSAQADLDTAFSMDLSLPLPWKYQGFLYQTLEQQEKACASYKEACSLGDCSSLQKSRVEGYCPT